jgi:hypothetical protein
LSIGLSGGNLLLSWPALSSAEGFRLEQNSYLPMNSYYYFWPPVSPSPTVTNGRNQVIVSPLPSQSFFRLNP